MPFLPSRPSTDCSRRPTSSSWRARATAVARSLHLEIRPSPASIAAGALDRSRLSRHHHHADARETRTRSHAAGGEVVPSCWRATNATGALAALNLDDLGRRAATHRPRERGASASETLWAHIRGACGGAKIRGARTTKNARSIGNSGTVSAAGRRSRRRVVTLSAWQHHRACRVGLCGWRPLG